MHDYVHKRIQREYRRLLRTNLEADEGMAIVDYIENFSCTELKTLYQDHYDYNQVTILIALVIRHRQEDETLLPGTANFELPDHLTAALHAFISDDKKHNACFAQLCMQKMLETLKRQHRLPRVLYIWSDGGPSHFKMYRQLAWMARMAALFKIDIHWLFFQSGPC